MQTLVNSHWTEHSPGTLFLFWPFVHHICQPGFTRFDSARQPGAVWICISITTAGLKLFFKWWRARLVYWSKENTQPPLSTYWKTPPLIGWQMHSISSHIKNHCCIATILRYLVIKKLLLWKCLYVEVHLNQTVTISNTKCSQKRILVYSLEGHLSCGESKLVLSLWSNEFRSVFSHGNLRPCPLVTDDVFIHGWCLRF